MQVRHGIAASPGIAIGPAFVLGVEDFRVPQNYVSVAAADSEVARLRGALASVAQEISTNESLASQHFGKEYAAIFGAHLQFIRDPKLISEMECRILDQHHSAEFAATQVLRRFAHGLQTLGDKYLAERANDIFDLERSLLRHLLGAQREELGHLTQPVIVLAHNLTPSETANLNRNFVKGFATEVGGSTSHTAILAGALEIPAIVGVGSFLTEVAGGEMIILDGDEGKVIVGPDEATLEQYRNRLTESQNRQSSLQARVDMPAETKDGTHITVTGNIEFPAEAEICKARGADGIGLYRTEFLYLGAKEERTEEDHYQAYAQVLKNFPGQTVVIRTVDLGADKIPGALEHVFRNMPNPELGLRSIRVSLEFTSLFRIQLRAILRAAVLGDVRIMFPLISSMPELRQAKMVLTDVCEDLEEQGIDYCRDVMVGMMVEVPSAAIMADEFAREVDFFSVGTNDLIQYTLATDRSDPTVAKYYNPADPAILRLLNRIFKAGSDFDIPVSVCGQMASDPRYIPLLLGLGLRSFSVTPQIIPTIKEVIRNISLADAEEISKRCLQMDAARDIDSFLRGELKRILQDE